MTPVYNFLTKDELPTDVKEASMIKRRACSYVIFENKLYRRGFSIPLLKCVDASQALEILQELHEGISGQHLGGRSLARKALRAGKFREFVAKLGTKQHFTSVEHPQTNGQAEAANRVILRGLKRRLGEAKKAWIEELHSVLWAYMTTPHSSIGETLFRLIYGTEAVIPVEIREPSRRTESPLEEELNDEAMREELDMVEEIRTGSSLREAKLKQ
ncbi:uncharacterized protein LOC131661251 [Vicia villosa]|uniref:uncharacterized protein LOC131661251 n=1 Tax=Vicia villosa TaxID=3911 RepID=UPI00273AA426|nr:uncharacterized protein LOC131661251 [Vicia villosa]